MFLNFHTHRTEKQPNEKIIFNQIIPEDSEKLEDFFLETSAVVTDFSVGIHPWFISEENFKFQIEILEQSATNQAVRLIGECGLDRTRGSSLQLQEQLFIKQIRVAEEVRKPILVHCVRCFGELVSIKKIIRPKIPMVIHGFNNNFEIAQQLLQKDFYFSLGSAILQENSNARKVLEMISIEKLFLETDDKNTNIEELYKKVSEVKSLTINQLEDIIYDNYLTICLQ